jgi:hypothetical protein
MGFTTFVAHYNFYTIMDQIHVSSLVDQIQLTLGYISNKCTRGVVAIELTHTVNKLSAEILSSVVTISMTPDSIHYPLRACARFPPINANGDFEYGLVPVPVVSAHGARRSASPMQFCRVGDHIVLHAKLSNFEATTVLSPSTAVM